MYFLEGLESKGLGLSGNMKVQSLARVQSQQNLTRIYSRSGHDGFRGFLSKHPPIGLMFNKTGKEELFLYGSLGMCKCSTDLDLICSC